MPKTSTDPAALGREIIAALDVAAEYKELGIEFTRNEPSATGWIPCWARNRPHGSTASAGVNVYTGVYKDHGIGGECFGLFDFAARYGSFGGDWREARRHYAKKTGHAKNLPKKKEQDQRPIEAFAFSPIWNAPLNLGLLKKYPQATDESLRLCGGKQAAYPAKGSERNQVITFGCYGADLLDSPPRGYACLPATGRPILVFSGEGQPLKQLTKMVKGKTGLVGHHGLSKLREAELIFKVEGLSDLIAMQAFIPPEMRDRHVVITNASGASELSLPSEVSPAFAGKDVVIIHDCDKPGQEGVQGWLYALGNGIAGSVRNLVLPYEITENHGKDLRDWIADGHAYDELVAMVHRTPVISANASVAASPALPVDDLGIDLLPHEKPGRQLPHVEKCVGPNPHAGPIVVGKSQHQQILQRLGLLVIGHVQGTNKAICFSHITKRSFEIEDTSKLKIETLLMHAGPQCEKEIQVSGEPDGARIQLTDLRKALAAVGGVRPLTDTNQLGVGIWELSGRLAMVGAGEVAIVNGDVTVSEVPELDGKLLDFGGSDPWFNVEHVRELYAKSADPKWCMAVCDEAIEIFSRWDNWVCDDSPEILTALVCCSWIQSVWDYRPSVCVTGGANTGKTMLMEECVSKMFGKQMSIFTSKPTEAGIRQEVGHTSKIILIDEFEHDKNRQQILNLFRSSTRGTNIIRGTTQQKSQKFHLSHIPWVSAIETGLTSEADRSRYIILDLNPVPKGRPSKLTLPNEDHLRALGNRLMIVAMRNWMVAKHLAMALKGKSFGEVDRRVVESYSVPCAMLAAVMAMNEEQATGMLALWLAKRNFSQDHETDEESLVQDILSSQVRLPRGGTLTVSQLLVSKSYDMEGQGTTAYKLLEKVGVKVVGIREVALDGSEGLPFEAVFFAPRMISRELLYKSRFQELDIGQILGRAKGSSREKLRVAGQSLRGIRIPVESLNLGTSDDNRVL